MTGGTYGNGNLVLTSAEASVTVTFPGKGDPEPAAGPVINEVSSRSAERDFVELYNGSDGEISLDGWTLTGKKTQSLDGYTIPAHGYLTLGDGYDAPLTAGRPKDAVLTLAHGGETADSLTLSEVHSSIGWGRIPDGGDMMTLYPSEQTPGAENGILPPFEMGYAVRDALVTWGE